MENMNKELERDQFGQTMILKTEHRGWDPAIFPEYIFQNAAHGISAQPESSSLSKEQKSVFGAVKLIWTWGAKPKKEKNQKENSKFFIQTPPQVIFWFLKCSCTG